MTRFLIILFLFCCSTSFAQNKTSNELSLYFDQPDALKKAGVNNVRCIFKDSRKLMWLGTENGLFRYDGTNAFYIRHKAGDTTSIPNNVIASITEDKEGNIWIGTMGGIACMNPYNFQCKIYTDELHNLPSGNFDNKVLVSSGEVWAGNSNGLYHLEKKVNAFKLVWKNVTSSKVVSTYVTSLLYWKPDSLVLGTFDGIVLFNTQNYSFKRVYPLEKSLLVGPLYIDAQHRLWIGTWGDGVFISNPLLSKFQQYKWEKDLRSGVDNIASAFAETSSPDGKNMWVGAQDYILKIPLQANEQIVDLKKTFVYRASQNKNNNDPGTISTLMSDDENYIWTGSKKTVAKFSADKSLFQNIPIQMNGSVENIQNIQIASKKYLAVSYWHGEKGLVLWDRQNNSRKIIDSIAKGNQYGSNFSGLAVDKYNRIWVASLAGTYLLDQNFHIITSLSKNKNQSDLPSSEKVSDILINNDTVWIACYKAGIDLYDLSLHKLKHFADSDGSGMRDNLVQRMFKDRNNKIWICGNTHFYQYLPSQNKFKIYDFSFDHGSYSPSDAAQLPDGHLVIATETAGLIYFDPSTEKFEHILTPLLEKEENILSVTSDVYGNIWYLTNNHLVKYQPAQKKFTLFGDEDGLSTLDLQLVRSFDGKEIFLAQEGRLLEFLPANWQSKEQPPQLFLHSLQINDSSVTSSQPLHQLHLNYNQNKIYFEFDGITYTKPEQNQYAYKLTGIDKDWSISNKNFISYANLSPGNYQFHVKAANYDGEWSKEYVITIDIDPPFWRTWWFIGLAIIFFGGIFFLVVRYVSQRNLRERILRLEKEQAVEKERNRIARDMHDDLGSGLTKIAILSEVAKTQLQQKEAASLQLENISHSSRELVDNLQNIIWVLNPKNDSLENLAAYIREYALKFFESTEIMVHFNYPQQIPSIKLSEEERRNIFMVIKETLNNTAKHSCCKNLDIDLVVKKKTLLVQISDDGNGFELSHIRPFANGLSNMKQRMEQIDGSYEIESVPGKRTVTTLTIDL